MTERSCTPKLRIAIWNIQWKRRSSPAGRVMRARIDEHDPDLICITEGHKAFLEGDDGSLISSQSDYGLGPKGDRRKVLLWTRTTWKNVEEIGDRALPSGRFIAGSTETALGDLHVVGVCVPWSHAHVTFGRKDRSPWEEHCVFLSGLARVLSSRRYANRTILLGDFNQVLPRKRAPLPAYEALRAAIPANMAVATEGPVSPLGLPSIDHLAHTKDFPGVAVRSISNLDERGRKLSDHFGLLIEVSG
jgi:hypothetical protein